MSTKERSYIELYKELKKLKGTELSNKLNSLQTTHYCFNINYLELKNVLEEYEKNDEIWAIKNRPKLKFIQKEITRHLLNFVSTAKTFREHTNRFVNDLKNKKLTNKHEELKEKHFMNNDIAQFIQKLRDYLLHKELPFINAKFSMKIVNFKTREAVSEKIISLDRDDLLEAKKVWNAISKNFLKKANKEINIKNIIENYFETANNFYQEFYDFFIELYKLEFDEVRKIKQKMIKLQK